MTEENQVVEVVEETVAEYSETEQEAIDHGWNPEGVEGKKNLSAEEFMDRKPLYDELHGLKKTTRKLQDGMEAMKQMQAGIRAREREKVISELQSQKKEALESENYDAVIAIDDKIAEERASEDAPINNTAFEEWVDSNEWYHQDPEMKEYADLIGAGYNQQNPNKTPVDIYKYVEDEVKKRYPAKFENPNRSQPNSVESASRGRSGKGGAKHRVADLPENDRRIMDTIVRTGTMSKEEYLKEYFGEG